MKLDFTFCALFVLFADDYYQLVEAASEILIRLIFLDNFVDLLLKTFEWTTGNGSKKPAQSALLLLGHGGWRMFSIFERSFHEFG